MEEVEDFRLEIAVKNNRIYSAIMDGGYSSVKEFCDKTGLRQTAVGAYINLRKSPINMKHGGWSKQASDLASALFLTEDDLWSDLQRTVALETNKRAVAISEEQASGIAYNDPDEMLFLVERSETINKMLHGMTEREEKVLRMRFGLGEDECTLEEVAKNMGVTRERIRQIEAKALRKLRHPINSSRLLDFVER